MSDDPVKQSLGELQWLVRCRCDPAYTSRNLRDPDCNCDNAEAVKIVTDRIEAQAAEIERLRCELANAVEEKLDAISTLDAWFDRRQLAHDALDQAVVDAASGYLRTSRCGGMKQKDSDLVLAVIQNMARLSVFADLFARSTLAELTGGKDE